MPLERMLRPLHKEAKGDPQAALAERFVDVPLGATASMLRRIAFLPKAFWFQDYRLVKPRHGAMIFRKAAHSFDCRATVPPVALGLCSMHSQPPGQPNASHIVEFAAREMEQFKCFAVSEPQGRPHLAKGVHAAMLILPNRERLPAKKVRFGPPAVSAPVEKCNARREPSILVDGHLAADFA